MAARLNLRQQEQSKRAIKTTQILKRLVKHAVSEEEIMSNSQVKAAEILLRKVLPDLKATEYTGNTPNKITFVFSDTPQSMSEAIEGAVIDQKSIEYQDKGSNLNVPENAIHKVEEV